jgi:uncharacterized protein
MTISMHQASAPAFTRMLTQLKVIVDKAAATAAAKKVDESVYLTARLYPDMLPMGRQIHIACDFAKGCCARLAGQEVPKYDDNEVTFADFQARIDKTIAYMATIPAAQIDGQEDRDINITIAGKPVTFKGQPYLVHFALPNFYFHLTTAYAILRHNGVDIGKGDFLGGR